MNSSDCEQTLTAVDLEEPPGTSYHNTSTSFTLTLSPPQPHAPFAESRPAESPPPAAFNRRAKTTTRTRAFRKRFFPDVPDKDWNDWRWQSRHRIRTADKFGQM